MKPLILCPSILSAFPVSTMAEAPVMRGAARALRTELLKAGVPLASAA